MVEFKYIDHNFINDQINEQNKTLNGEGGFQFSSYLNNIFHHKYAHKIIYDNYKPIVVQIYDSTTTIHHTINLHYIIQNMDNQKRLEFLIEREFYYFENYQEAEEFIDNFQNNKLHTTKQKFNEIDCKF